MKKFILISVLSCLLLNSVFAQSLHVGIKAGGDFQKIKGQYFNEGLKFGYHAGVFAEIGLPFTKIGLQPEIYFSQVNKRVYTGFGFTGLEDVKLNYINIPVLLNFKPLPFLSLQAGPQFGVLVNKDKSISQNGKDVFKSNDAGIAAGLQLNLTKIKIYARYIAGLSDVNNTTTGKWHNQNIHLGVGFRLF